MAFLRKVRQRYVVRSGCLMTEVYGIGRTWLSAVWFVSPLRPKVIRIYTNLDFLDNLVLAFLVSHFVFFVKVFFGSVCVFLYRCFIVLVELVMHFWLFFYLIFFFENGCIDT